MHHSQARAVLRCGSVAVVRVSIAAADAQVHCISLLPLPLPPPLLLCCNNLLPLRSQSTAGAGPSAEFAEMAEVAAGAQVAEGAGWSVDAGVVSGWSQLWHGR